MSVYACIWFVDNIFWKINRLQENFLVTTAVPIEGNNSVCIMQTYVVCQVHFVCIHLNYEDALTSAI